MTANGEAHTQQINNRLKLFEPLIGELETFQVPDQWALSGNSSLQRFKMPQWVKDELERLFQEGKVRRHSYTAPEALEILGANPLAAGSWTFKADITLSRVKAIFSRLAQEEKKKVAQAPVLTRLIN